MHPILLELGRYRLTSYLACVALAYLASVALFRVLLRRLANESRDDFWLLANAVCVSGFLGARLFFWAAYRRALAPAPGLGRLLFSNSEGLSTFGAIFGVIAGTALFCRIRRIDPWEILDRVALVLPVAHALARTGCLLAGCCYGRPVGRPAFWAMRFTDPRAAVPAFLHGVPLYPTQLAEIAGDILTAAVLYIIFARRKKSLAPGSLLAGYALGYGILRLAVDPYRADFHRLGILAFSLDQALAVATLLSALALLLHGNRLRLAVASAQLERTS